MAFKIEEGNLEDSKFELKIKREYEQLEKMILDTSEMFEELVRMQGPAIKLQYSQRVLYLCLVRENNSYGKCCGVRWAKYQFSSKTGRRSWYNGWLPGKVPPSTVRLMSPEGKRRYQKINKAAISIVQLRRSLTTKKKRILATFQNIKRTDNPRKQEVLEEFNSVRGFLEAETEECI